MDGQGKQKPPSPLLPRRLESRWSRQGAVRGSLKRTEMMRNAVLAVIILVLGTTTAGAQNWAEKLFTKNGAGEPEIAHDFKTVAHGAQLVHRFSITNIYAFPFDITELRVSCGCLKATSSK